MNLPFVMILLLAGLVAIFIIQNVAAVDVTFLFWSLSVSRALLIFFTLVIGFVSGWFLKGYFQYRKAKKALPGKSGPRETAA